jgi:hypothetical protein
MPAKFVSSPEASQSGPPSPGGSEELTPRPAAASLDWDALRLAGRSCCCLAGPAIVAVMPPAPGRPHETDLLLCMHHYRASRHALVAAGATVLDLGGELVNGGSAETVS